jgi:hypothetical protein
MPAIKVKFIKGYSRWFKLPKENLVKVVIDNDNLPHATRKFICEALLSDILEYREVNTQKRRIAWVKSHPEWDKLEFNVIARRQELEARQLEEVRRIEDLRAIEQRLVEEQLAAKCRELEEMLEPEVDSFEYDFA